MKTPLACWFYGAGPTFFFSWGGSLTSMGVSQLSSDCEARGIESHCFRFADVAGAEQFIVPALKDGRLLILGGYSLGVTSITYLQTIYPTALLLALAGSKLGRNSAINKHNTKRSVAWRDPNSILSGFDAVGFDVVHDMTGILHLWFDFDATVVNGVNQEIDAFLKEQQA